MGILKRAALIFMSSQQQQARLESAVTSGDHHAAAQLLDAGVAPDFAMKNHKDITPLMHAAGKGDTAMIRLLLAAKADPLLQIDKSHLTAWQHAAAAGQTQALAIFMQAGVHVNAAAQDNSALVLAAANSQIEAVQFLCDNQADINLAGTSEYTPLHWACYRHEAGIADILLRNVAKTDAMTKRGDTPMMMLFKAETEPKRKKGSEKARLEILSQLITAQAPLEQRRWDGNTALHLAIHEKVQDCALALIAAGANVQAQNKDGETPVDFAARLADKTIMTALQSALREKQEKEKRDKLRQFSDVRLHSTLRPLPRIRLRRETAP